MGSSLPIHASTILQKRKLRPKEEANDQCHFFGSVPIDSEGPKNLQVTK